MHTLSGVGVGPALIHGTNDKRKDDLGMWRKTFTQSGLTKHSLHCEGRGGRRDLSCYRCVELELGAAPRNGWQHEYFAKKLRQEQRSFEFETGGSVHV